MTNREIRRQIQKAAEKQNKVEIKRLKSLLYNQQQEQKKNSPIKEWYSKNELEKGR